MQEMLGGEWQKGSSRDDVGNKAGLGGWARAKILSDVGKKVEESGKLCEEMGMRGEGEKRGECEMRREQRGRRGEELAIGNAEGVKGLGMRRTC